MILKFYVNHQTLQLLSRDPVVADSSGYLQANFLFTDDWEGTDKAAQFKRTVSPKITDGKPLFYDIAVDSDGNCTVPWEVLVGEGMFNVNIYGQKTQADGTTVKTITVNSVDVPVGKSGLTKDMIPQDSTPSRYDNIYEKILATEKKTQTLQTEAAASQAAAKTSETNAASSATSAAASAKAAATSATAAARSATNVATSETNAKTSEANAANSATLASNENETAKAWATSTKSPDGATDTDSSTGKTQSSKTWALYSKDRATAAASSATAAAGSATMAKNWAESTSSPDDATDSDSSTGKTQSSKSWATYSKDRATAAASSATAAETSAASALAHLEEINRPVYYLDSDGCLCEKIFVEVTE